jgi:site-specific DNA-methyltransferase (adenine-specific)
MKEIQDKSIDMILCDLPYGTTACKWDNVIPFEPLWEQYNRIIKDNGAIILFATEPFASKLRLSNIEMYKYDWCWIKSQVGNFLNCKNSPLKKYEMICVFSKGNIANGSKNMMRYYPQGLKTYNKEISNSNRKETSTITNRESRKNQYVQKFTNYPNNILEYKSESGYHPTQKPIKLLEYLIKTYSNEGESILDNCMGSGSTGVACLNTNRNFIGIELDVNYFNVAKDRIEKRELELKESKNNLW